MSAYQEIEIEVEWCPLPIVVGGYYSKAERGLREHGVQMEPDFPAYFDIDFIIIKGSETELVGYLSGSAYDEIAKLVNQNLIK